MTELYTPQGLAIIRDPHYICQRTFFHDLDLSEEEFLSSLEERESRQRGENPHLFKVMDIMLTGSPVGIGLGESLGHQISDIARVAYWGGWSDCYIALRDQGAITGTEFTTLHLPIIGKTYLVDKIRSQSGLTQRQQKTRETFEEIETEGGKLIDLMASASKKRGVDLFLQAFMETGDQVNAHMNTYRAGFYDIIRILEEQERINQESRQLVT